MATRPVQDAMGIMEVPEDAYYGASTMRAVVISMMSPSETNARPLRISK